MPRNATDRAITGAVIQSGRIYKAGDEDALALAMKGRSMDHLIEKGAISGDWSAQGSAAAKRAEASADASDATDIVSTDTGDESAETVTEDAPEAATPRRKSAKKATRKR
jgi:hypothetical protein